MNQSHPFHRHSGILRRSLLIAACVGSVTSAVADSADAQYQAFLQARGKASWINANAGHPLAETAYRPIPALESFPADPAKRDLGFDLFHDASLSRDGTVGCNTCHRGMLGATDGRVVAQGIGGALGARNTPTVFNAAFNFRQFWDGRAMDLDAQSLAPITDPVEMGHDLDAVLAALKASPVYSAKFAAVYPDGVTAANLGNAISQHTKDMTRTDSPFNAYLEGADVTLSESALRGQERFEALGCVACHNGINLGGNSYQSTDLSGRFAATVAGGLADKGLAGRTQREQDQSVFKVPQLHNVALTAPYYHDGSIATLEEAVVTMARTQAGREPSAADVSDIVAFLESLSSEFFSRNARRMSGEEIQNSMRQQMPDAMQHQQHQHNPAHHGGH